MVPGLHSHDRQSALLKQDSPGPKLPGVHPVVVVVPPPVPVEHILVPMLPTFVHMVGHELLRHSDVATETPEAGPQLSAEVHVSTEPPW
jgi:hypothetical protein